MLKKSEMTKVGPVLLAIGVVALAGQARAAELNALSDLKVVPTGSGAQVVVSGTRAPTFTAFRLSDPDRLVVDISSADAAAIKGHHDGAGPIAGVVTSQFSDERASVARVLVALGHASRYDVRADGNQVLISVNGASAAGEPASEKTAAAPEKTVAAPEKADDAQPVAPVLAEAGVSQASQAPEQIIPPASRGEGEPGRGENVVASRMDEQPVKHPASRVRRLAYSRSTLQVITDGEVAKYELIELADPPRLALDVYGVGLSARVPKVISPRVRDLRAGAHADKVRLVLDVVGSMPDYRVVRQPRGLELRLGEPAAGPAAVAQGTENGGSEVEIDGQKVRLAETAPVVVKPEPAIAETGQVAEIKDISFTESPGGGQVELKVSGGVLWKVERPDPRSAVLVLSRARLPRRLERSLDTSALDTPVKMVSAFSVPGAGERVRVVVSAGSDLDETVTRSDKGLSWRLSSRAVKTEEVAVSPRAAGFTAEATRYAAEGTPRQSRRYTGKRVSFEFKDIDIHNLLRVIAEVSKKNVVVADDVSGKVTIRLRNVPWDQALDLILRSKGLGKEELGNIIRVAPLKTLEEEAKLREERNKSEVRQASLVVQLIPVNYATADQMKDRVKEVLSERGSVTVDTRTNVLIVRDVAGNIGRARSLVQNLDTPTPQVLIESRIVEANTNFKREIGVQWGGHAQMAPGTGNPTGLIFPNTVSVRGGSNGITNGTADEPHYAVSLPAPVGSGEGGAIGFVFGSVGGAVALNLRLSAMENQGSVKTISAPKVTTLDNNTAKISQGVSIPFSQVSSTGVNTSFIEARLALEVTPHITQDGSILMAIKAENNQPDPSSTGANGQPSIMRKEANTQVLVKDGDTTVIGGIYVRSSSYSQHAVPFLSKLPILGFFFRNNSELDQRQELLIFITPHIINRQPMAQSLN